MEYELAVKIGAFFIGAIATWKPLYELQIGQRSRMRDEYRFAKEFLQDIQQEPSLHPFLREKGYRAIAGNSRLSAAEIEYLLSLNGADQALKDYAFGRRYLEHISQHGNLQIDFKAGYKSPTKRTGLKWGYFLAYMATSLLAFVPMIFSSVLFKRTDSILLGTMLSFLIFLPYAWLSLRASVQVNRAEKLVKNQSKHTQAILLEKAVHSRTPKISGK